jgi:hypothetical protein
VSPSTTEHTLTGPQVGAPVVIDPEGKIYGPFKTYADADTFAAQYNNYWTVMNLEDPNRLMKPRWVGSPRSEPIEWEWSQHACCEGWRQKKA